MIDSKEQTGSTPKVRFANPDEYPTLHAIQIRTIQGLTDTYSPEEIEAWITYLNNETAGRYANFNNAVHVGDNGSIDGFVSWSLDDASGVIECLYTNLFHQNDGIGTLLLHEAESMLVDLPIHVRSTLNAVPFYEKNGYKLNDYTTSRAGFRIARLDKPAA